MKVAMRHWYAVIILLLMLTVAVSAAPVQAQTTSPSVAVIAARATLWAGPGRGFWTLGSLPRNETVPALGKSADGQFYQVNSRLGVGWLLTSDIDARNAASVTVIDPGTIGYVTAARAIVRGGPGIESAAIASLSSGTQFYVIGRRPDGSWLEIRYRYGRGWIAASVTNFAGGAAVNTNAPATNYGPYAIVNTGALTVRTGPGFEFAAMGTLRGGVAVAIIGKNQDGTWLQVRTVFGSGWVNINFVITKDYFGSVPVTENRPGQVGGLQPAILLVLGGSANVRSGPNTAFPVLFTVNTGERLSILGQSRDKAWWYVQAASGAKGWINKALGQASGTVSAVPVLEQ
ncbi:MAG: SH3 domain-containing protein [Anaerolineae bacterium]|nr:SH3 domain-containing protein [Anaerolineae bacterium]